MVVNSILDIQLKIIPLNIASVMALPVVVSLKPEDAALTNII